MKKLQCKTCNGAGIVRKLDTNLQFSACKCDNTHNCYLCENSQCMGFYKECEICWGTGEIRQRRIHEEKKSQQLLRNG